jgi:hypothetical protein
MGKIRDGRTVYLTPEVKRLVAEQLARVDALGGRLAEERNLDHVIALRLPASRRPAPRCPDWSSGRCGAWPPVRPGCRARLSTI